MFKGEIPFVRLLIPQVIGIVVGLLLPGRGLMEAAFIAIFSGLCLLILSLIFYKNRLYRHRWICGLLLQFILLSTGVFFTIRSADIFNKNYFSHHRSDVLIVTVKNEPLFSGDILRFEAFVDQSIKGNKAKAVSGKLLIALKSDSVRRLHIAYGDRLLIPSRYYDVDPPFNPAEFDYQGYLKSKQIYKQTFVKQQDIKILSRQSASKITAFAFAFRQRMVEKFYTYLEDKDAAAMASTLILGYRSNLSKEVISAYSRTGTMHVLSVSGMHVAIVFLVLAFLMRPLQSDKKLRLLSAFIIISSIWFYSLITGFSPSVCRAAMMLSFVVLGKTLNRSINTYNLLAISAFFLLIYNPYNLVDVGFQLSYLAVIGLVYLQPKIYHLFEVKNKLLDYLWSYSALSISAQLATFPISVYYFHQFPVYFLVSNLLVVLPVAVLMYAGIAFLVIPWTGILNPLGDFLNGLILYTNSALFYIEKLPYASIGGIWISTFEYLLIYLIVLLFIWAGLSAKKLSVYISMGFIFLLSLSVTYKHIQNSRRKELIFYSLRKYSAIAYIEKEKAYLISDLIDDEKTWTFSINPALESRGVSDIKKIRLGSVFTSDAIKVSSLYMQFGNYRLIRWNKELDDVLFSRKLKSDMVLLSGNPRIQVKQLIENITFSALLIDASNFDYRIKQWKAEAELLNVPVYVLKKQPAYVLKL